MWIIPNQNLCSILVDKIRWLELWLRDPSIQSASHLSGGFLLALTDKNYSNFWTLLPHSKDRVCVCVHVYIHTMFFKGFRKRKPNTLGDTPSLAVLSVPIQKRGMNGTRRKDSGACPKHQLGWQPAVAALAQWPTNILYSSDLGTFWSCNISQNHTSGQRRQQKVVCFLEVLEEQLLSACLLPLNASCCLYGAQCSVKPSLLGCLYFTESKAQVVLQVL